MVRFTTRLVMGLLLAALSVNVRAAEIEVPRWQIHDFVFTAKAVNANPFTVPFSAEITGPGGVQLTVPGFFDGDGTWKVRMSPTTRGSWSLRTRSSVPELNDRQSTFTCTENSAPGFHGALRVDPQRPHQFAFEDGTPYLPIGYECDWLWALDADDPQLKTINAFLDKLTAQGFNYMILNTYAHDTSWRKGKTSPDDFGPPPFYPWEGSNENPDHSRFNLTFWQHYDGVIHAMYQRGIVAHILMKVYNKQVKWPVNGSIEDDLYFRWLIARYAAYPNVTWDLAKESQYEKDVDYKTGRLRFIRANDPYRRLLTVHDDHAVYDRGDYDHLVDYRSDQQHTQWRGTMLAHLQHAWPVINTEFGYECGPKGLMDKTYNVVQTPEEVCRRAWEVYMAGGFGVYYYTYTAWDVLRPQETPPGYAYFKHLSEFFKETGYWRMKPVEGIASDGSCLADAAQEYIVFLNAAAPFTLKLEELKKPLQAEWYQPLVGLRQAAGSANNGTSEWKPPAEWGSGPVVLHVGLSRQ